MLVEVFTNPLPFHQRIVSEQRHLKVSRAGQRRQRAIAGSALPGSTWLSSIAKDCNRHIVG